jgi:hypothetical protein
MNFWQRERETRNKEQGTWEGNREREEGPGKGNKEQRPGTETGNREERGTAGQSRRMATNTRLVQD